jgi:hypothetical protein
MRSGAMARRGHARIERASVPSRPLLAGIVSAVFLATFLAAAPAWAGFGIKGAVATITNAEGIVDLQAGSHPFEFRLDFEMNQDFDGKPEGSVRTLIVDLPAGMVGNSLAVPRCSAADFEGVNPKCPGGTQVGVARVQISGDAEEEDSPVPLYNLTPPLGVPAMIGLNIVGNNSFNEASLRPEDYGVRISDITVPNQPIQSVDVSIWGLPALGDKPGEGHFDERFCIGSNGYIEGCASDAPLAPFLSLPTSCGEPLQTTLSVSSVEEPDALESKTVLSGGETPTGLVGCNALQFNPTISAQPTTNLADSPSGLNVTIQQPQDETPEGLSSAHLKDATVTLPQGISLNPSAANGLSACSQEQIGYAPSAGKIRFSAEPQSCPNAAKVGTLEAKSPLVDHKLPGAIYLAQPFANPFGSLLAIYLAVEDEQTGTIVKLAGKVSPDPQTGQLTARFTENPQLPIEEIETHFFGGPRGTLKTPLACGNYTTTSTLVPWSTPEGADATPSSSFATSVNPGGGPCPSSEVQAPNKPAFSAGTLAPQAGAYSPFGLRLSRPDGFQQLSGIDTTLPKGLTGKLAGIPYCSEAQLAVAKSREAPKLGGLEQASPSCPPASEVGTVTVGAGAGITPLYVQGHAYLAGPYRAAPLSLAIVIPVVAGPFDLGAVVVRAALQVDPKTVQLSIDTDPLPTIRQGIPLNIRSIAIDLDRPGLIGNPTSCDPTAVQGEAISAVGQTAALRDGFQVGGCAALAFKPKLAVRLLGPTRRGAHPGLRATLQARDGDANLSRAAITLPGTELLDNRRLRSVCTRARYRAGACPARSIYGHAEVRSPLLSSPLAGPIYLRESKTRLPDLVASLDGQIHLDLVGHIESSRARLRVAFEGLPDVPVRKLVLTTVGGERGLLVNTGGLCAREHRASAGFKGHNGKLRHISPVVRTDC